MLCKGRKDQISLSRLDHNMTQTDSLGLADSNDNSKVLNFTHCNTEQFYEHIQHKCVYA